MNTLDYMTIDAIAEATEKDMAEKEAETAENHSSNYRSSYIYTSSSSDNKQPAWMKLGTLERSTNSRIAEAEKYRESEISSHWGLGTAVLVGATSFVWVPALAFVIQSLPIALVILLISVVVAGIYDNYWIKTEGVEIKKRRKKMIEDIKKEYEKEKAEILNNPS